MCICVPIRRVVEFPQDAEPRTRPSGTETFALRAAARSQFSQKPGHMSTIPLPFTLVRRHDLCQGSPKVSGGLWLLELPSRHLGNNRFPKKRGSPKHCRRAAERRGGGGVARAVR